MNRQSWLVKYVGMPVLSLATLLSGCRSYVPATDAQKVRVGDYTKHQTSGKALEERVNGFNTSVDVKRNEFKFAKYLEDDNLEAVNNLKFADYQLRTINAGLDGLVLRVHSDIVGYTKELKEKLTKQDADKKAKSFYEAIGKKRAEQVEEVKKKVLGLQSHLANLNKGKLVMLKDKAEAEKVKNPELYTALTQTINSYEANSEKLMKSLEDMTHKLTSEGMYGDGRLTVNTLGDAHNELKRVLNGIDEYKLGSKTIDLYGHREAFDKEMKEIGKRFEKRRNHHVDAVVNVDRYQILSRVFDGQFAPGKLRTEEMSAVIKYTDSEIAKKAGASQDNNQALLEWLARATVVFAAYDLGDQLTYLPRPDRLQGDYKKSGKDAACGYTGAGNFDNFAGDKKPEVVYPLLFDAAVLTASALLINNAINNGNGGGHGGHNGSYGGGEGGGEGGR